MRFDTTLLLQSIAMLTAILLLLHIVIKYKPKDLPFTPLIRNNSSSSYSSISDSSITSDTGLTEIAQKVELKWYQRTFWDWDHFRDYVGCLSAFAAVVGVFYLLLHQYQIFISILGFLSLGIESTLPVPQLLTNFKYRNTSGFSLVILGTWFLGDSFKAFYFFYNDSPVQFVVCAIIQLSFDTMIVLQFIVFSNPVKKRLGIRSIELPNDV
ncbi:hypothetical protein BDB01DRAFT_548220 [Pilobolus umbonatus]|nr:hypothetical protein BDB01DRAFT_548220 [Pilobolus umbonatus]